MPNHPPTVTEDMTATDTPISKERAAKLQARWGWDKARLDADPGLRRMVARWDTDYDAFERQYFEEHADEIEAERQQERERLRQLLGIEPTPLAIPDNIDSDKPLPLDMAARVAFPDGSMTVSGLRNEIKKGNLQASKVAGRIWTTLGNIKRMMERCQIAEAYDAARVRNFTSANPSDREASSDGSSSTAPPTASASREAQAHLSQIAQRLRKPSPPTSPKSTSPTSGKVVPIKS